MKDASDSQSVESSPKPTDKGVRLAPAWLGSRLPLSSPVSSQRREMQTCAHLCLPLLRLPTRSALSPCSSLSSCSSSFAHRNSLLLFSRFSANSHLLQFRHRHFRLRFRSVSSSNVLEPTSSHPADAFNRQPSQSASTHFDLYCNIRTLRG